MGEERVEPLIGAAELGARVTGLAREIAAVVPHDMTVVALLKGALVFAADLLRALDAEGCRPRLDCMQVSSYGLGQTSSGQVKVLGELPGSVAGAPVLLVDDIQDTGRTLLHTRDLLLASGAARVWSCVLLDKPSRRLVDFEADFKGFEIADVFVVGYGIDYAERWRHLPFVGVVAREG